MAKVAIIGGSPSSSEAPWHDESWDIWCLGNQLHRFEDKRITRLFELHDNLQEHDPGYPEWIVSKNIPLVVGEKFPIKADHVTVFDYDKLRELIGYVYFTSSPACMLAQAIFEGYEEIGIYGIDMAVDDHEYFKQRACMEGWIGYAKGLGIKITIAESSPLCKWDYVEGRDWNGSRDTGVAPFTESEFLLMAQKHQDSIEQLKVQIRNLEQTIAAHDGSRQTYERLAKVARANESGMNIKTLSEGVTIRGQD